MTTAWATSTALSEPATITKSHGPNESKFSLRARPDVMKTYLSQENHVQYM